jgi:hypothetical protein
MDNPSKHKFKIEVLSPESSLEKTDCRDIFSFYEKKNLLVDAQVEKLPAIFLENNVEYKFPEIESKLDSPK